ncbi:MAG: fibrobacter succinogenes major paralogous domain-containing protein [Chitinispirillia bacterium]|nr:fibrobacter succinogenes major paralogous domain-containing protein [Chitinispirillia bacterium]
MKISIYNGRSVSRKNIFLTMLILCAVLAGCGGSAAVSKLNAESPPQNEAAVSSAEIMESDEPAESMEDLEALGYGERVIASLPSGILADSRDGKEYRYVKIDNKKWMAENINFETGESWCYGDDESNCGEYGRLYSWDAAMKACPAGWRLPGREEWANLFSYAGDHGEASRKLKSQTGWRDDINGTDEFGFSIMPSGLRLPDGIFRDMRGGAYWWSATEEGSGSAWSRHAGWVFGMIDEYSDNKEHGFSVRCIQE